MYVGVNLVTQDQMHRFTNLNIRQFEIYDFFSGSVIGSDIKLFEGFISSEFVISDKSNIINIGSTTHHFCLLSDL